MPSGDECGGCGGRELGVGIDFLGLGAFVAFEGGSFAAAVGGLFAGEAGFFEGVLFGLELHPAFDAGGIEVVLGYGCLDGTSGLCGMGAIGETAGLGEGDDIGEGFGDAFASFPELELAHAGGVDEEGTPGEGDEVAVGGGVAAAFVAAADGADGNFFFTEPVVYEGGFSGSGEAEEGAGGAGGELGGEGFHAFAGDGADEMDGDIARDGLGVGAGVFGVAADIELGEDDDGAGDAIPGEHEVALEAAGADALIEGCDEENGVDIRGDDLLDGAFSGGAAGEFRGAGEDGVDDAAGIGGVGGGGLERDPVADGGEGFGRACLVGELPGCFRESGAIGGRELHGTAVAGGDACGDEAALRVRGEGCGEVFAPSQCC